MKYLKLFENSGMKRPRKPWDYHPLKTKQPTIKIECIHDVGGDFDDEATLTQKTSIHYKKGDQLTLVNYYYPKSKILPRMYPIEGGGWISIDDVMAHFKVIDTDEIPKTV